MIIKNLKIRAKNLPFIEFKINDKTLRLLVDTGSQVTRLDDSYLKLATNLEHGGFVIGQSGQSVSYKKGNIVFNITDDLEIGAKEHFLNESVTFADMDFLTSAVGFRIDGLIGSDFLRKYNVLINYNENYITIN